MRYAALTSGRGVVSTWPTAEDASVSMRAAEGSWGARGNDDARFCCFEHRRLRGGDASPVVVVVVVVAIRSRDLFAYLFVGYGLRKQR